MDEQSTIPLLIQAKQKAKETGLQLLNNPVEASSLPNLIRKLIFIFLGLHRRLSIVDTLTEYYDNNIQQQYMTTRPD